MTARLLFPLSLMMLAACGPALRGAAEGPAQQGPLAATGQTVATLDQATPGDRAEALAPGPARGALLGEVTVGLGNPAEPGFWLRSALVAVPGRGQVVLANGQSLAVDLLPGGSGAQMSLSAFRALGLPLTDLPRVSVYGS